VAPDYYDRIVGAAACRERPATCDLSRGIVADDAANTVTIHLTEPDPDLLHRLALPFAHAVAPSAPREAPTTTGLPATGPYVIASHIPGKEVRFVRNPRFREWSRAARPDGYPDEILVTVANEEAALTAVEEGRIDVDLSRTLGPDEVDRLTVQYPDRVSTAPLAATLIVVLNTKRPPFDHPDARRAVAFALDRAALTAAGTGPGVAQPACQILPPSFPAHEPYCPFTTDPGDGRWHGRDLDAARALVARSGTAGADVTVNTFPEFAPRARQVAATLDAIGYRARAKVMSHAEWLPAAYPPEGPSRIQAGVSGWAIDFAAPSSFFEQFRCGAGDPSDFCDPAIDARIDAALDLQARDPAAADTAWASLDRELTDRAGWIPFATPSSVRLVSERAGNVVHHPVWDVALDQMWVQ
jgi:peptide/nickel transport system substrate-binding protein